jgi:hypothetical protein
MQLTVLPSFCVCYLLQILCRLCVCAPGTVLALVDTLIEPIEKTVTKKTSKEGLVGPEVSFETRQHLVRFIRCMNATSGRGKGGDAH